MGRTTWQRQLPYRGSFVLENNGIKVYTIAILNPDGEPVCLACDCLSGRKIVISTPEDNQQKAKAFGFTVQ